MNINFFNCVLKFNLFWKKKENNSIFPFKSSFFWCSRAALEPLAGRMWPAGHVFETPALNDAIFPSTCHINRKLFCPEINLFNVFLIYKNNLNLINLIKDLWSKSSHFLIAFHGKTWKPDWHWKWLDFQI